MSSPLEEQQQTSHRQVPGSGTGEDVPPAYPGRRLPPSYAAVSRRDSAARAKSIDELIPDEEERLKSLQKFVEEKSFANDYFGGHKGAIQEGEGRDPFKVFRWIGRKVSGQKGEAGGVRQEHHHVTQRREGSSQPSERPGIDGEVGRGEMDTSVIL